MDKIVIRELKLFAYHGVNESEKVYGQNFVFDIDCFLDISKPCKSDNVEDTVSYAKIIKTVRRVFTAEKYDLLERASEVVATAILEEYPAVLEVKVLLKKPEAPIKADFDYVGVEITRSRK